MYLSRRRAPRECNAALCSNAPSTRQQLPLGSHSVVGSDVDGVGGRVVAHSQTQVCDTTRPVLLHQDVLGLQVPVSYCWFAW